MAKTKRRQLAALAAKAEARGLSGTEERIASCQEAGPSGTTSQKNDPLVEIRIQRVIIKIPSLPANSSAAAAAAVTTNVVRRRRRKAVSTADVTSKTVAAGAGAGPVAPNTVRRRKRKASSNVDLSSTLPADGVKRRRRARVEAELKPQNVLAVEAKVSKRRATISSKQSGKQVAAGDVKVRRRRASAKSKLSSKDEPPEAVKVRRRKKLESDSVSEQVPADEAKLSKVILKFGKWKREKTIREQGSPVVAAAEVSPAGRQSRTKVTVSLSSRKRMKVQEEVTKSPAEVTNEEPASRVSEHTPAAENGDAALPIALEACPGDPVLSLYNSLVEVGSPCNGDGRRNRASSPILFFKRKRGSAAKAILQATAISEVAEREDTSRPEAVANGGDGFLESQVNQSKKSATPLPRDTPSNDISTVRTSKDEATSSGAQAGREVPGSAKTGSQQNLELPQIEPVNVSCHEDLNVRPTLQQTYQSGAVEEDQKPHWQMELVPFTPGKNGVFLVIKQEKGIDTDQSAQCSAGKDVIPRGAELIKQNNQLAIINKRLDAAGGLRKWLLDRGLGQFVPIFDDKKIDTLTLLQITMTGLKEMGMIPVGPRRKLIHALSCLTDRLL
ncbi:hypothetical protein R1flu_006805 [Riccia fluitans]|uniref:SAM domain-containing protein n=1 Tax=Riccia fluitans TaxID=41844 RepID=A0ABD1YX17_9MARC